jgi:hypothetical protein
MIVAANEKTRGHIVEPTRIFTPARIIALAVIAVVTFDWRTSDSRLRRDRSPCPRGRTPATWS